MVKTYSIFISHSWLYGDAFEKIHLFFQQHQLDYDVCPFVSRFFDDCDSTNPEVVQKLEQEIKKSNCLIILAGVYDDYGKWVEKEIEIAKRYNKPIIAVELWSHDRTSNFVRKNVTSIVKWQSQAIVDAVRNCCR